MKRKAAPKETGSKPTKKTRTEPVAVVVPEPIEHAKVVVFGGGDTSQLTDQYDGETEVPRPLRAFKDVTVLDVQSAGYHTALLLRDESNKNRLWTWGCNDDGVLGRPTRKPEDEGPNPREDVPTIVDLDNVVKIAVGDFHMCALTEEGKLYGWGSYKDEEGFLGLQIGLAKNARQRNPVEFKFKQFQGYKIVDVASSGNSTIVLTSTGRVFQWGCTKQILPKRSPRLAEMNDRDQLLPHYVPFTKKGVRIFSGGNHHFVVTHDGEVYSWGINGYGQLGLGDAAPHEIPQLIKGLKNVVSLSCGQCHTLALTKEGDVYSFGRNAYGQLGLGNKEEQDGVVERLPPKYKPQLVSWFRDNLKDDKPVQIYCGGQHSSVVTKNGDVYAWGFGDSFRLGTGNEDDADSPAKLTAGKWHEAHVAKRISSGSDFGVIIITEKK